MILQCTSKAVSVFGVHFFQPIVPQEVFVNEKGFLEDFNTKAECATTSNSPVFSYPERFYYFYGNGRDNGGKTG